MFCLSNIKENESDKRSLKLKYFVGRCWLVQSCELEKTSYLLNVMLTPIELFSFL